MSRQSSTPYRGSTFRSLTGAVALGAVMALVSPALASVTLDAVTAVEGYPVERNYSYVVSPINPHYSAWWNSARLSSGWSAQRGHLGTTVNSLKD
jgi:hypothetical protein